MDDGTSRTPASALRVLTGGAGALFGLDSGATATLYPRSMFEDMDRTERLRLLRFVTSFAWADGVLQEEERNFLHGLMKRLPLGKDEIALAEEWLETPPHPAEVDPTKIPEKHRNLFLMLARGVIRADGQIDDEERERFELLEQMLKN